jgi:hypothetical protein
VFVAYPGVTWAKLLPQSLAHFGRVSSFDYVAEGFDFRDSDEFLKGRDKLDEALWRAFTAANALHPVDAVVSYLSGTTTDPKVMLRMANAGAAVFNFCWDDKLGWPGARLGGRYKNTAGIAHAVDLNLTNAPTSLVKYAVHGGLAMFWPESALPAVHRPWPVDYEFNVSFVGARYGWRPFFIERLKRRYGIHVECFGYGWSNGSLSDDDMVKLYSRSRINLGFAGVGHSRRLMCLKARDFEVPLSGGLYLTQNNPELALVYDVGKDIVTFRDERDCARSIRELLADPLRCERIRAAGRERCLRDHTYDVRWSQVFRLAGLMR